MYREYALEEKNKILAKNSISKATDIAATYYCYCKKMNSGFLYTDFSYDANEMCNLYKQEALFEQGSTYLIGIVIVIFN